MMKEFNFAETITAKRREKGITQDTLAAYVGVTKASVSKWETGQSYPDISLLPILAAYFDMSIDDLMGYSPQMTEDDIEKTYQRLAKDFMQKPFDSVMAECEAITKKYYSCYLLLIKMAVLYLNHAPLANDPAKTEQTIKQAAALCERAAENSKAKEIVMGALNIQATCHLALKDGAKVLELLGESLQDYSPDSAIISQAHLLLGNKEKAAEVMQADLYFTILKAFQSLMMILQHNIADFKTAEPVYKRAEGLADLFNMRRLLPNNKAILYILGAQMYQQNGFPDKTIALLEKFTDVCINGFFPLSINADEFFDKLGNYIKENATVAVRNEAAVKADMLTQLQSPIFADLQNNPEYVRLVNKLKTFVEGGN